MGTVAFAFNDVVIKTLGRKFDPLELAFFRYLTGMVVMAPIFVKQGMIGLRTKRLGVHGLRLALATAAQLGVLISVIKLPLAVATSLAFSRILFTPVVAVILVKEVVTGRRWAATAFGFVGVVVMVRPGQGAIDPVALIAIGSALSFAVANVLITLLSKTEPPIRILFYYHLGGVALFAIPALAVWRTPIGIEWILAAAIGVLTTLGMVGFVRGFAVGAPSVIGPMEYTRLIYAAILGFFFFSEIPDFWTVTGALIVVASTTSIARMDAHKARAA